jgi:hypothetical protein
LVPLWTSCRYQTRMMPKERLKAKRGQDCEWVITHNLEEYGLETT